MDGLGGAEAVRSEDARCPTSVTSRIVVGGPRSCRGHSRGC